MAITIDVRQSGPTSSITGVSSISWSHTVGAGANLLLVGTEEGSASNFNASTVVWDSGGANTALSNTVNGSAARVNESTHVGWSEVWYLKVPASGTKTIKVTYGGTVDGGTTGSESLFGVDQGTTFNAASPQTATGSSNTASLAVTSAAGQWVFAGVLDNETNADTLVKGGGMTDVYNISIAGPVIAGAAADAAGASSVTMQWTGLTASPPWAVVGISLIAAVTGGGFQAPRPTLRPVIRRFALFRGPPPNWRNAVAAISPTVIPNVGVATWTGFAPFAGPSATLTPDIGAAIWTGFAPTVAIAVVVTPGVGAATWTGLAPTILNPLAVFPGVGAATWTGLAPTVKISVTVLPGVGAATWAGLAPTVVVTNNITVTPGVGLATWNGLEPTLTGIVVPPVVGGGGVRHPRARAEIPKRKARVVRQLIFMAEDVVCETGTGIARWTGLRPRVRVSDSAADDALTQQVLAAELDDPDLTLALALAGVWED